LNFASADFTNAGLYMSFGRNSFLATRDDHALQQTVVLRRAVPHDFALSLCG
jgi:hypothetical protein